MPRVGSRNGTASVIDLGSERRLVLGGLLAGAIFAVAMMGGHLWAVARVARSEVRRWDRPKAATGASSVPSGLLLPVDGIHRQHLRNSFDDARGSRPHAALDILAPRETLVRAVAGGTIARLSSSRLGGTGVEQLDEGEEYCYYYGHLERHAEGLREGQRVLRGQVLGYVGTTGNAAPAAPHLHFAVFRLGPERACWTGTPVNPYPLFQ